jgi:molybdate transport system substrate-binding protein
VNRALVALFVLLVATVTACGAREGDSAKRRITVAAASDLQFALDDVVTEFRVAHPEIDVRVVYGSSGNFHAQLVNRAPFDLYFSADIDYPRRLADLGLAIDDDVFAYAVGRIVVWVPAASPLDLDALGVAAVADPAVRRLAIANPEHAPYGRAAIAALESLGLAESVRARLVLGENISQAAQFVESGAADAGIIALSLALAPRMRDAGRFVDVPLDAYPTMLQGGMIPTWSRDVDAAKALRDFTLGARGREVMARYGFLRPD